MKHNLTCLSQIEHNFYQGENFDGKELCVKGKIKTQQRCPKCKSNFIESTIDNHKDLWCTQCLTHPRRYYIDIFRKKQLKIYSDQDGRILDSYELSHRLLNEIRQKIDKKPLIQRIIFNLP